METNLTIPSDNTEGRAMHDLAAQLFPIHRSLTGEGVRKTLGILGDRLPGLNMYSLATGSRCFDWQTPKEWHISGAKLTGPTGEVIADFKDNNLHVVGYSTPVDLHLTLDEIQPHIYSLPEQPDAIPYVTSYYKEHWGFCIPDSKKKHLKPGVYHAHIESTLKPGVLDYADILIPGQTDQEIFFSTYICHPSMANNELSGPIVATFLANWILSLPNRRYSYRFVFIPETIGSICYLSRHLEQLQKNVVAGFNLSCLGDEGAFSYLPTRIGDTLSDRTALHVLHHAAPGFRQFSYLWDRASDERQYNSPGVDLPVITLSRSMYKQYPEYHTSLDNLDFITPKGLAGSLAMLQHCVVCLENNVVLKPSVLCEPQLGKYGLYPKLSIRKSANVTKPVRNLLAYTDGKSDLLKVADSIEIPLWELLDLIKTLKSHGLLQTIEI